MASEIQIILSDDVFRRARVIFADSVRAQGLPADVAFSAGSARADVMGESNVFVIGYVDARPAAVPDRVQRGNAGLPRLLSRAQGAPKLADFFADEITDVRNELDTWRIRRNEFMNQEKFFGAEETSRFLLNKIGTLEQRLTQLTGDVSSQELRVANLEGLSQKSGSDLEKELAFSMSQHVLQSGIVQNIKFELQKLNMRREELAQMYTEKHPELIAVEAQIADLHEDLKQQVDNAYRVEKVSLSEMKAREQAI